MNIPEKTIMNMIDAKIRDCERALEYTNMSAEFYEKHRIKIDAFVEIKSAIEAYMFDRMIE